MLNNNEKLVYTVYEVAYMLGLSLGSTYHYISAGHIPSVKVGARILIPREPFKNWLYNKAALGKPKKMAPRNYRRVLIENHGFHGQ